ncbi:hypothetical protein [uncultured Lactobacillus sp.]|uniref:hypothetical protein n=1 Tax=uncultured Lactobacillus sp. TaxID=153152 RepID=UPI00262E0B76|nr:hypothetical protein [uncultured Lactobacillus sp.]
MKKILISTVHHPNVLNDELIIIVNELKKIFDDVYVSVSTVTDTPLLGIFKEMHIKYLLIPPHGAAGAR